MPSIVKTTFLFFLIILQLRCTDCDIAGDDTIQGECMGNVIYNKTLADTAIGMPVLSMKKKSYKSGELLIQIDSRETRPVKEILRKGDTLQKFMVRDDSRLTGGKSPGRWAAVTLKKGSGVPDAVSQYARRDGIIRAQPNFIYRALEVPDDALFGSQWGLKNSGQEITVNTGIGDTSIAGTEGVDINITGLWDEITDCGSVIVAVIDSGIDYDHVDLKNNMWDGSSCRDKDGKSIPGGCPGHGWDFLDSDADPMDDNGHGTHVAGIIGASGNNSSGVSGVCWKAALMAVRALDFQGNGTTLTVADGIDFAIENGAEIINTSLGSTEEDRYMYEAVKRARDRGVILVASAGNENSDNDASPLLPASYDLDNVISVAAVDQDGNLAGFSNYGSVSVDIAAPGVNIVSSYPFRDDVITEDYSTGWYTGGGWGVFENCSFTYGSFPLLSNPDDWCSPKPSNYGNNADDRAYRTYDLSGIDSASVGFYLFYNLQDGKDFLDIQFKPGGGDPFNGGTNLESVTGDSGGSGYYYEYSLSDCLDSACSFGFRLRSDSVITGDGVSILAFSLARKIMTSDQYQYEEGTSMSAPYVSGLAALLRARFREKSYRDIILAIYRSGRSLEGLQTKICTGAMIDAEAAFHYLAGD